MPADQYRRMGLLHRLGLVYRLVQRVEASLEVCFRLGPQSFDNLHGLFQHLNPNASGRKGISRGLMVSPAPTRADAQLQPAAADNVQGGRHFRQQSRRPVGIGQHDGRQPDLLGDRRQGGKGRPALQEGTVQQIEKRGRVVAQPVGLLPDLLQRLEAVIPLVDTDTKFDLAVHLVNHMTSLNSPAN